MGEPNPRVSATAELLQQSDFPASEEDNNSEIEEDACCRICRCGSEEGRELFHPCKCTGSIRYVHEDCLLEWLSRIGSKNKSKCELCGHYFSFIPIYSPDTPKTLSSVEMAKIFAVRLVRWFPFVIRVALVIFAWGVFVPQISCLLFRNLSLSSQGSSSVTDPRRLFPTVSYIKGWYEITFGKVAFHSWCTGVTVMLGIIASFLALLIVFDYVHGWTDFDGDAPELQPLEQPLREERDIFENLQEEAAVQNEMVLPHPANVENGDIEDEIIDINLALDEFIGLRGSIFRLIHHVMCLIVFNGLYLVVIYYSPTWLGAVVVVAFNRIWNLTFQEQLISRSDIAYLLRAGNFGPNVCQADPPFTFNSSNDTCTLNEYENMVSFNFWNNFHYASLELISFASGHILLALLLTLAFYISRFLSHSFIQTGVASSFWRSISRILETFVYTTKVCILIVMKMGFFPVILGLLLEKSCRSMFAFTDIQRMEFACERPIYTIMIFWVAGITHMLVITVLVVQLREIVHEDVLKGIIRSHDPNTNLLRILLVEPLSNHLRRMIVSCAIYTALIALFISMPLRATNYFQLSEHVSWFPFRPNFSYYFLELQLPLELAGFHLLALHALDYFKQSILCAQTRFSKFQLKSTILVMQQLVEASCRVLGLTRFLLPCYSTGNELDSGSATLLPRIRPNYLCLRLCGLVSLTWFVSMAGILFLLGAPFLVGSFLFTNLKIPIKHDPYVFFVGSFVIWRFGAFIHYTNFDFLLRSWRYLPTIRSVDRSVKYARWLCFILLAFIVLPCLIGTLIHMVCFMPLETSYEVEALSGEFYNYSSLFVTYMEYISKESSGENWLVDEWVMGIIVLFITMQIIGSAEISANLGIYFTRLHNAFKAGLDDLCEHECDKMLYDLVYPCVRSFAFLVFMPFILTFAMDSIVFFVAEISICRLYGLAVLLRRSIVLIVLLKLLPTFINKSRRTIEQVHDALRDEKYLVGRQLLNMEKRLGSKSIKKRNVM